MCITVLIVYTSCILIIAKCAPILTKDKVSTCNKKKASLIRQEDTCVLALLTWLSICTTILSR